MANVWYFQYCPKCGSIGLSLSIEGLPIKKCAFDGTLMMLAKLEIVNGKPKLSEVE